MFKGSLQSNERKIYPCTYSNYAVHHDEACPSEGIDTSIHTPGTKWKRAVTFVIRQGNRPENLDRELGEPQRLLGRRGELK